MNARTGFHYFQTGFKQSDLRRFRKVISEQQGDNNEIIENIAFSPDEEITIFWRIFLITRISKIVQNSAINTVESETFFKAVEILKLVSKSKNVGKKYPSLEKFHISLSKNPKINIEGTFEDATPEDLEIYLEACEDALEDVYLGTEPVYLFVDEMEIYKTGNDGTDRLYVAAAAALVKAIRDFNERFYEIDVRIVSAVRTEVMNEVSGIKDEVYRAITNRGISIGWDEAKKERFHALERIVLKNIASQDIYICETTEEISEKHLTAAFEKYFPRNYSLSRALDLTWYRPRDIALLFEIAQKIDSDCEKFRSNTLTHTVLQKLGERMFIDARAGLGVKYTETQIAAIERVLRGGNASYTRETFKNRLGDLADQYDDVALLSDTKWIEILEDLYRVGVIFTVSQKSGHKNFFFRGDPMPSFTDDFKIGIHQSLIPELSISS